MKFRIIAVLVLATAGFVGSPALASDGHGALRAFRSDTDLKVYLNRVHSARRRSIEPAYPPSSAGDKAAEMVVITGQRAAPTASMALKASPSDSITNNQVQGVDEGDIVKASGNLVVVLRRGRLFTLSIAGGSLKPVDAIDAFPPGVDPRGDWYDEMLIADGRIVVIGYSYARGGTQVDRFRVTKDGRLSFEDAYALKSNDYYSSRNYASRLIGTKLVFYSPRYLGYSGDLFAQVFPGLRRWSDADKKIFKPIGTARNVYVSPAQDPETIQAVHTVASCDVAAATMTCTATSVLGPDGRVFFVSSEAVYVWVTPRRTKDEGPSSMLYRLPLDGGRPTAVKARGAPVDQFSFRETDRGLDVLVRADSPGEAMWAAERSRGDIALVHVPFDVLGDGREEIPRALYRSLPQPTGSYYTFHNRFVGDFLLYGEGNGWGAPKGYVGAVTVVPVNGGAAVELALTHGVDRLDAMGRDAVVIGSDDSNVVFSAVVLKDGKAPALGDRYVLAGAAQGETRSHGFFFKPEAGPGRELDGDYGVLGLPVMRPSAPAYEQLFQQSAGVVFVRRTEGRFVLLGELPSHPGEARDDACKASCVDWYGNARPIFYDGRTFALMGYELVEATLGAKDMTETARLNFAPGVSTPLRD